jgi:initiation factor 1A
MVKNVKGGTGHKKQASKYTTQPSKLTVKLRLAVYEGEIYAQVTKLLGNGMCHVLCDDLKTRLCFIRGKFRGRGKRDNTLTPGKWILIGLRDYETAKKDKLDNCDLLEIYSDLDKDRLQSQAPHINWSMFIANDNTFSHTDADGGNVRFVDEREDEYEQLIVSPTPISMKKNEEEEEEEDEEYDFDDI